MTCFSDRLFSYIEVAADAAAHSKATQAAYSAAVIAHDALISEDPSERFMLAKVFFTKHYSEVTDLNLPYQATLRAAASKMRGLLATNGHGHDIYL